MVTLRSTGVCSALVLTLLLPACGSDSPQESDTGGGIGADGQLDQSFKRLLRHAPQCEGRSDLQYGDGSEPDHGEHGNPAGARELPSRGVRGRGRLAPSRPPLGEPQPEDAIEAPESVALTDGGEGRAAVGALGSRVRGRCGF